MATRKISLNLGLLAELGLTQITEAQGRKLLSVMYDTLELMVGHSLANRMTGEQLEDFEALIDQPNTEGAALEWLETNLGDYRMTVQENYEELKGVLAAVARREDGKDD